MSIFIALVLSSKQYGGSQVAPQVHGATNLKWPLGGLSNLFIFISDTIQYNGGLDCTVFNVNVLKIKRRRITASKKNNVSCVQGTDRQICIRKTCPCNLYPLIPNFYIAKLGYAGVCLFFLFLIQNIECGYLLEPPQRDGLTSSHNLCFEQKY